MYQRSVGPFDDDCERIYSLMVNTSRLTVLQHILRSHRSAWFPMLTASRFSEFDTCVICHAVLIRSTPEFCLICQKICQREATSSANNFLHPPKYLQAKFKDFVYQLWRLQPAEQAECFVYFRQTERKARLARGEREARVFCEEGSDKKLPLRTPPLARDSRSAFASLSGLFA